MFQNWGKYLTCQNLIIFIIIVVIIILIVNTIRNMFLKKSNKKSFFKSALFLQSSEKKLADLAASEAREAVQLATIRGARACNPDEEIVALYELKKAGLMLNMAKDLQKLAGSIDTSEEDPMNITEIESRIKELNNIPAESKVKFAKKIINSSKPVAKKRNGYSPGASCPTASCPSTEHFTSPIPDNNTVDKFVDLYISNTCPHCINMKKDLINAGVMERVSLLDIANDEIYEQFVSQGFNGVPAAQHRNNGQKLSGYTTENVKKIIDWTKERK
tara:strand:- start:42 stop:863 length:822 start_codon:yes stop_codon:yes gene_type:complete